ncbi:MAG: prephenate dehydratase [Clostridium sp.]
MLDLEEIRNEIDRIDNDILKLFSKRMDAVIKVAEYKKKNNLEVLNRKREEEVIERHLSNVTDKQYKKEVEKFLRSVMEISRQCQRKFLIGDNYNPENIISNNKSVRITKDTVVGFQGVEGSYSEEALYAYFGKDVNTKSVPEFEDVFRHLNEGDIEYGVLPIENSSTGGVLEVYDLLSKYEFSMVGEMCIKINHCLIGIKDSDFDTIKQVYSHPQGLSQCSDYLNGFDYRRIPYTNTAKSVEFVRDENSVAIAAIGSKRAASIYDLKILKEDINTSKTNTTRFLIISKKPYVDESCNKISVVFSVDHKVGCLYNVLKYFAENEVNMLKIESRPMKERPWEYIFYIDFTGNITNPKVKIALESIKDNANYFRMLGNYKKSEEYCWI